MSEDELQRQIALVDKKFQLYLDKYPQGKFSDFYVQQTIQSLEQNIPHQTLGDNLKSGEDPRQVGIEQLKFLKKEGLQPQHTIVDYGCGSLRVGQHLIRYLAPQRYWGLDITDVFMQMGVERLSPQLMARKKPQLRLIDATVCGELRRAEPDFVYCRAVLRHVPPTEVAQFIEGLLKVVTGKTLLLVSGACADQSLRIGSNSWAHTQGALRRSIEQCGASVQFETKPECNRPSRGLAAVRSMLMRIRLT